MYKKILKSLEEGNARFVAGKRSGDVSEGRRRELFENGQWPYAVVVACSDSRVAPELIFDAGLGELFVIRVAGNVISDEVLGSIEYAVEHCGAEAVIVLGHDCCGAVHAAVKNIFDGHVGSLTRTICNAIGGETDEAKAAIINVKYGVEVIKSKLSVTRMPHIIGAIYNLRTGKVDFVG